MRIPPTPERLKEVPAQVLRALFAGVGQVLLITERVRQRALGPQGTPADPARDIIRPAPAPPVPAGNPAADISPPVPAPTLAGAAQEPAAGIRPPAPGPSPAEAAEDPVADIVPAAVRHDDLPLAGYSGLSIASLRARLRGLDTGQVRTLLDFERAHENRENVTTMFERRLVKLEGEAGRGAG